MSKLTKRLSDIKVTKDSGPAPDSKDKCFYCNQKIGEMHKFDCVIPNRNVWIKATIRIQVNVPLSWDKDSIEFHRNDSSWCANNFIKELDELDDKDICICPYSNFEYDGEVTDE